MQETAHTSVEDTEEIASIWRRTAARGQSCLVKSARHNTTQRGRLKRTAKAGCEVEFEDKHVAFIYWRELYPDTEVEAAKSVRRSLGKIGDVANLHAFNTQDKSTPPAAAAPVDPPLPTPPLVLGASIELEKAKAEAAANAIRKRVAHEPTAIGNLLRNERMKHRLNQEEMAELLEVATWKLGDFELGDQVPELDDPVISKFSKCFNISRDILAAVLAGKSNEATDPLAAIRKIKELEDTITLLRESLTDSQKDLVEATRRADKVDAAWDERFGAAAKEYAAALSTAEKMRLDLQSKLRAAEATTATLRNMPVRTELDFSSFMEVSEFMRKLAEINPMPAEEKRRRAWYELAFDTHSKMRKI